MGPEAKIPHFKNCVKSCSIRHPLVVRGLSFSDLVSKFPGGFCGLRNRDLKTQRRRHLKWSFASSYSPKNAAKRRDSSLEFKTSPHSGLDFLKKVTFFLRSVFFFCESCGNEILLSLFELDHSRLVCTQEQLLTLTDGFWGSSQSRHHHIEVVNPIDFSKQLHRSHILKVYSLVLFL